MSEVEKLKPCPFCGEEEGRTHSDASGYNWSRRFWVTCSGGCVAHGPEAPTEAEAIAAWNRSARADWKEAAKALTDALADERDYTLRLRAELTSAREYVVDALDAHEHSDGRELLQRIDAALSDAPQSGVTAHAPREDQ